MGPLAKKTYSRKKNEIHNFPEKNKENIDPFDELLASPLKQDVSFKPLSYWNKAAKDFKVKKDSKNDFNKLFKFGKSNDLASSESCWVRSDWKILNYRNKIPDFKNNLLIKKKKKISTWKVTDIKNDESSFLKANNSNFNQNLNTSNNFHFIMVRKPHGYKTFTSAINFNQCNSNKIKTGIKSYESEIEKDRKTNNFTSLKIECNSNVENKNEIYSKDKVLEEFFSDKNIFKSKTIESDILSNDSIGNKLLKNSFKKDNMEIINSRSITSTKKGHSRDYISKLKYFEDKNYASFDSTICKKFSLSNTVNKFKEKNVEDQNYTFETTNEENTLIEKWYSKNSDSKVCEDSVARENLRKPFNFSKNGYVAIRGSWNSLESFLPSENCKRISNKIKENEKMSDFNEKPNVFEETAAAITSRFSSETFSDTLTLKKFDSDSTNLSSSNSDSSSQINDNSFEGTHSSANVEKLSTIVSNLTISNDILKTEESCEKETMNFLNEKINTTILNRQVILKNNTPFKNITLRKRQKKYLELKKKNSNETFFTNMIQHSFCSSQPKCQNQKLVKNDELSPISINSEFGKLKQIKKEFNENLNVKSRKTLDISRLSCGSASPIFESTRIDEGGGRLDNTEIKKNEENTTFLGSSVILKPGKQWMRSMSVLRQLQNDNILSNNSKTEKIKGKNFANFVEEISKLQNCNESTKILEKNTLNCTLSHTTMFNHMVKVINEDTLIETNNSFAQALGLLPQGLNENSKVSAKDFILTQCGQDDVLPFEEYFNENTLRNCEKIGEGVFGEVFKCDPDTVFKVMPIEGDELFNGEPQKTFEQILSEIVVAAKLSNLRYNDYNRTSGFCEMTECWCVTGKYPKFLIDLWDKFNLSGEGSENDSPIMFKENQIFIILVFKNGGKTLESYVFNSAEQSFSVFSQIALSLAAAEKAFEFEHRDLHWGNILVSRTKDKYVRTILDNKEYKIATKGVKVCIIDFTLSRINHEGCSIYNNLAEDPTLFLSEGDYQFEIYRMMQKEVENEWWQFKPKTNLYWLLYVIDKMLTMVKYKNTKTFIHQKFKSKFQEIKSVVDKHENSSSFIYYMYSVELLM